MSPTVPESPQRMTAAARLVVGLSCLNLGLLCLVSYVLFNISETWWVGTVLTYAPHAPLLIPTLMLLVSSLFWQRESFGINLVSAVIILVPLMGLSIPLEIWLNGTTRVKGETSLKILSCNVQAFKPDFGKVLDEIAVINPDIVAFQETFRGDERLDKFFRDWHTIRHGHYFIGSRFPVKLITDCEVKQFSGRTAGMVAEIETPAGPIVFCNIHQMTARPGLMELNKKSFLNGDGAKELQDFEGERLLESIDLRAAVDSARGDKPLIVCGDFNTPTFSSLFQRQWGDLQSSFDIAGFGYGYTSPCKGNRFWPDNLPWVRIDHILCSSDWAIRKCQIGESDGSDHRLIAATVVLKSGTQ